MSTETTKPIIKQGTRILTPYLYGQLCEQLNDTYLAITSVLLCTGMRAEEFWDFMKHPEWYDAKRKCIDMPKGSIKKVKCLHKERSIVLTSMGCAQVEYVLKMRPHKIQRQDMWITLRGAAERAGIGTQGITTKMFRKSIISWLAVCYPDKMFKIASSAGHSLETMRLHYSNLQFEARDVKEMQDFVKGWGEA